MTERESSPDIPPKSQPASSAEQVLSSPKKTQGKPLPDWKPLGAIRDYFSEQIKQDGFR